MSRDERRPSILSDATSREDGFEEFDGEYLDMISPTNTDFPQAMRTIDPMIHSPISPGTQIHSFPPISTSPAPLSTDSDAVDLRSLEYVSHISDTLICTICVAPLVDPVQLPCEHIFCLECLNFHFDAIHAGNKTCPKCRRIVNAVTDLSAAPRIIRQMLDDVMVKCPNPGCSVELHRYTVEDHVERYCDYSLVECAAEGCEQRIQRQDLDQGCLHVRDTCEDCEQTMMLKDLRIHRETCEKSKEPCPHCNDDIPRLRLRPHIDQDCLAVEQRCPGNMLGCSFSDLRPATEEHSTLCSLAMIANHMKQERETREREMSRLEAQVASKTLQLEEMSRLKTKVNILEHGFERMHQLLFDEDGKPRVLQAQGSETTPVELLSGEGQQFRAQLDQHVTHQDEVNAIHFTRIEELDARMQMWLTNENLRWQQDMLALGAAVTAVRSQLNALATMHIRPSISGASTASRTDGGDGRSAARDRSPIRRMSAMSLGREDPKL